MHRLAHHAAGRAALRLLARLLRPARFTLRIARRTPRPLAVLLTL